MKKLALLLAVILLFSFTGCKKQPDGNTDPTTTTTTAYTPTRVDTFTVGTVNGTSYENAYFGIGCNLGSDWAISDAAAYNPSLDTQGDLNAAAANAQQFYDMFAVDPTGVSVEIYVENLTLLMDTVPSLEDYMDLQRSMYEGNPNLVVTDITTTISNRSYKGLQVTVDETLTDVSYYLSCGNYMVSLRFLVPNAAMAEQLLPAFYTF